MKILVMCGAGMSSSVLMKHMAAYAAEHGRDCALDACSETTAKYGAADEYDIVLIAPQIAFMKDAITPYLNGTPYLMIPPLDYGRQNSAHIFQLIDETLADAQ